MVYEQIKNCFCIAEWGDFSEEIDLIFRDSRWLYLPQNMATIFANEKPDWELYEGDEELLHRVLWHFPTDDLDAYRSFIFYFPYEGTNEYGEWADDQICGRRISRDPYCPLGTYLNPSPGDLIHLAPGLTRERLWESGFRMDGHPQKYSRVRIAGKSGDWSACGRMDKPTELTAGEYDLSWRGDRWAVTANDNENVETIECLEKCSYTHNNQKEMVTNDTTDQG